MAAGRREALARRVAAPRPARRLPATARSAAFTRYALALVLSGAGLALTWATLDLLQPVAYGPLYAAVAITVWLLGAGPGLVAVSVSSLLAAILLVEPRYTVGVPDTHDAVRWLVFVVVSSLIVGVGHALHRARERAEARGRLLERLQQMTASMLAAETLDELAAAVRDRAADAVGALGGAIGVRRGDEGLELLTPLGDVGDEVAPGTLLPFDSRMAITEAARTDRVVEYPTREAIERASAFGSRLKPGVRSAIAVPLHDLDGRASGAIGIYLARDGAVGDEVRQLAETIASLCEAALNRIGLLAAERLASERMERLQGLAAQLGGAVSVREVAAIAVREVTGATGAVAATFTLVEPGGRARVVDRQGPGVEVDRLSRDRPLAVLDAIANRAPVWLPDRATWRERYPASEAMYGPDAASAAALPLLVGETAVGALGFVFAGVRRPDEAERAYLLSIAGQCAQALDRVLLYEEQRDIARTLQEGLLPSTLPEIPGGELAVGYRAAGRANEVGGDFYDVFPVGAGWLVAVGDVCGKGADAARLTGLCRHTLRAGALRDADCSPADLLALLNRAILDECAATSEFASVACVRIEPRAQGGWLATVASGGHPAALVRRDCGLVEAVKPSGPLVGIFEESRFAETALALGPADALVLYTDGVPDMRGPGGTFGESRLRSVLLGSLGRPAAETVALVEAELAAFRGDAPPSDDVAIVALRFPAASPAGGAGPAPAPGGEPPYLEVLLPADPALLAPLRATLRDWFACASCEDADLWLLATCEAVANVMRHAYRGADAPGLVTVELSRTADGLLVSVTDSGRWVAPDAAVPENAEHGRGFMLMRAVADEVAVEAGDHGTRVVLTRRLAPVDAS